MSRFMTIKAEEIAEAFETERMTVLCRKLKETTAYPFCKVRDYRDGSDRL